MVEIEVEVKVLTIQVYSAKRNITILNKRNYRRYIILENTFQLKMKLLTENKVTHILENIICMNKTIII